MTEAQDNLEVAKKELESLLEKTEKTIQENPLASVAVAMAVGFFIGMIANRK